MKSKLNQFIWAGITSTIILASCKKDDVPSPIPQAGFTQNRQIIEAKETVSFQNNSTNAVRFDWDFGNGVTSTDANPTVTYAHPGNFKIKMIAYNPDGVADTTTGQLKVGTQRYLKGVKILNLNFQDPNGNNWDADGSGPDVRLFFKPGQWGLFGTNTFNNVNATDLPLIWVPTGIGLSPLGNYMRDEIWTFTLEDTDNNARGDKTMYEWTLNPSLTGVKDYSTGKGYLTLADTLNKVKIEVNFEVL